MKTRNLVLLGLIVWLVVGVPAVTASYTWGYYRQDVYPAVQVEPYMSQCTGISDFPQIRYDVNQTLNWIGDRHGNAGWWFPDNSTNWDYNRALLNNITDLTYWTQNYLSKGGVNLSSPITFPQQVINNIQTQCSIVENNIAGQNGIVQVLTYNEFWTEVALFEVSTAVLFVITLVYCIAERKRDD